MPAAAVDDATHLWVVTLPMGVDVGCGGEALEQLLAWHHPSLAHGPADAIYERRRVEEGQVPPRELGTRR